MRSSRSSVHTQVRDDGDALDDDDDNDDDDIDDDDDDCDDCDDDDDDDDNDDTQLPLRPWWASFVNGTAGCRDMVRRRARSEGGTQHHRCGEAGAAHSGSATIVDTSLLRLTATRSQS
jgi:hypothetical protein